MSRTLDTRGKACPLPILELARLMTTLAVGEQAELIADDPAAAADVAAWCEATGNALISLDRDGSLIRARVERIAACG